MPDYERAREKILFRVFPEGSKAYLQLYSVGGTPSDIDTRVEVERPVSKMTLDNARVKFAHVIREEQDKQVEKKDENLDNEAVFQEIRIALGDSSDESLLSRAKSASARMTVVFFQILMGLFIISLAYKGVEFSQENLHPMLNVVVLFAYVCLLCLGLWSIATERRRWQMNDWIRDWFGPRGWIMFPALLLVTSAAVFASFTFIFFEQKWLQVVPGGSPEVSVASLLDFYMWHFMKLVPLLKVNDVLNWDEPLTYTQSRVGFLILLFQGFVVVPAIGSVRFYWKNRHVLDVDPFGYVFDGGNRLSMSTKK